MGHIGACNVGMVQAPRARQCAESAGAARCTRLRRHWPCSGNGARRVLVGHVPANQSLYAVDRALRDRVSKRANRVVEMRSDLRWSTREIEQLKGRFHRLQCPMQHFFTNWNVAAGHDLFPVGMPSRPLTRQVDRCQKQKCPIRNIAVTGFRPLGAAQIILASAVRRLRRRADE